MTLPTRLLPGTVVRGAQIVDVGVDGDTLVVDIVGPTTQPVVDSFKVVIEVPSERGAARRMLGLWCDTTRPLVIARAVDSDEVVVHVEDMTGGAMGHRDAA